ncbi:MAG: LEA type 2 family protein [Bacteroidales bacterium]
MKKQFRLHLINIIIISFIFSGCSSFKDIEIGEIENVEFKGLYNNLAGLELTIPVSNPNNFKINIIDMNLDISINGKHLGKMTNLQKVVIPSRSEGSLIFPLQVELSNMLSGVLSLYKLRNTKNFEVQINGSIKARSFLHFKTIDVNEKHMVNL